MKGKVTAIVPHHLNENQEYLTHTVNGLLVNYDINLDVVVVADTAERPVVSSCATLIWDKELDTASAKVNYAVSITDSDYIWIVSDDVMVTKNTGHGLMEGLSYGEYILNPLSNSDNNSAFLTRFKIQMGSKPDIYLPNKLTLADIQGYQSAITRRANTQSLLIPVPFVPFFCTMMRRETWNKVGPLDPELDAEFNDADYCFRAFKHRIRSCFQLGTFALHFGGQTLPKIYDNTARQHAKEYFDKKWTNLGFPDQV